MPRTKQKMVKADDCLGGLMSMVTDQYEDVRALEQRVSKLETQMGDSLNWSYGLACDMDVVWRLFKHLAEAFKGTADKLDPLPKRRPKKSQK